jgi:hypothetical protein
MRDKAKGKNQKAKGWPNARSSALLPFAFEAPLTAQSLGPITGAA